MKFHSGHIAAYVAAVIACLLAIIYTFLSAQETHFGDGEYFNLYLLICWFTLPSKKISLNELNVISN